MSYSGRLHYYRRILSAYFGSGVSQLTFWHDKPEINPHVDVAVGTIGEYYMPFCSKADYAGLFDNKGIPLLNYRGTLGPQYNPIAIAQYGLGNFNLWLRTRELARREKYLSAADWLVNSLEPHKLGSSVWMHKFDWEYRDTLRAPWHSALAQGQGISLLLRALVDTGNTKYEQAAERAIKSFSIDVREGGVAYTDSNNDLWFEEYIVFPPTHILNGFIWASWGVYDYYLVTKDTHVLQLFQAAIHTLERNLRCFDTGYWSLYELSGNRLPMLASSFYHQLHIVQLKVLHKMTGIADFENVAARWESYSHRTLNRKRAYLEKVLFKVCYY